MKILWLSNLLLPVPARKLGLKPTSFGGWVQESILHLSALSQFQIFVAMRGPVEKVVQFKVDNIAYIVFPGAGPGSRNILKSDCEFILRNTAPDLIHAEGSELEFTKTFLMAWGGNKILSLQGLLNGIEPYYLGGIKVFDVINFRSPALLLAAITLKINYYLRFRPRLRPEKEALNLVSHVIGRTLWDQCHALSLNPNLKYFKCNRFLRSIFYKAQWSLSSAVPYSIFIGNSAQSYKGVHIALKAASILLKKYPHLKLHISGEDPNLIKENYFRKKFGYPAYITSLIKYLDLSKNVIFLGELDSEGMASAMCSSRIYLLSSIIENSPNTLAEALTMGVPSVAAYVGGVPTMARDEVDCLMYRAEDYKMLAFQISRLLDSESLSIKISKEARAAGLLNYNIDDIKTSYSSIYGELMK